MLCKLIMPYNPQRCVKKLVEIIVDGSVVQEIDVPWQLKEMNVKIDAPECTIKCTNIDAQGSTGRKLERKFDLSDTKMDTPTDLNLIVLEDVKDGEGSTDTSGGVRSEPLPTHRQSETVSLSSGGRGTPLPSTHIGTSKEAAEEERPTVSDS